MEITFEDSGTPLKKSKNRKGETSGEQLRRMCKEIADSITFPKDHITASDWMGDVYDIRYLVDYKKRYLGAEIMVAGGGPTIWVDTWGQEVKGYWGGDRVTHCFTDELDLDGYCQEMYGS